MLYLKNTSNDNYEPNHTSVDDSIFIFSIRCQELIYSVEWRLLFIYLFIAVFQIYKVVFHLVMFIIQFNWLQPLFHLCNIATQLLNKILITFGGKRIHIQMQLCKTLLAEHKEK